MQKYSNDIATLNAGALIPLAGASCYVYNKGTTTLATIYSDNGVTTTTNPLTSSSTGNVSFYAADGRYDLSIQKTGYTTVSITDVILEDTQDSLTFTDTGIIASFSSTTAGYNQVILQNKSSASNASTNLNVSNDAATASTNFVEMGINSSGFTGSGSFNQPSYGYLACASTDLAIGTYAAKPIRFVINSGTTDSLRIDSTGKTIVAPDVAPPAGGTAGLGLNLSSTNNLGVFFGSGAPTLSAAQGSLYIRTDGSSTSTRLYVNTNGTTGWTNVTTAA